MILSKLWVVYIWIALFVRKFNCYFTHCRRQMWQLSLLSPCCCTWYDKLHKPFQVSDKQMTYCLPVENRSLFLYLAEKRNPSIGKIYGWIFVYIKLRYWFIQKPHYSDAKLIAFWRNACILYNTRLEFCQAAVSSIMRIVHMSIPTGKIHSIYTQLAIN